MVVGLNTFSEYFKEFQNSYLIIGGTACDIIIEDAGFTPRATDDIDIILIVEALTPEFVKQFWTFIKDGGYQVQQKEMEKKNCYRFNKPQTANFPKLIELFCKVPDVIDAAEDAHLIPIPVEEGLSSLSAILLNEDYYQFTIQNAQTKDGVHFATPHSIICLKAYAYLSNKLLKEQGKNITKWNVIKHKYDVFRMVFLLPQDQVFETPETIKADLQTFANTVKTDLPDPAIFKDNGFGNQDMQAIFNQLVHSFNLTT
jgi:hypothetical protein